MRKKIGYKVLGLLLITTLLYSCNSFDKLLKNPDFGFKYREANRLYDEGKYDKAVMLYENVYPFYRSTPQDDTIIIQIARSYYHQSDYEMSEFYFNHFREAFPRSGFIEEADYYTALSSYDQSLRPELDQTKTKQAITSFNMYLYKYPNSPRRSETEVMVKELEEKIEEKDYLSAKLYYRTEHYKAAIVSLKNFVKTYPDSKFREEVMYLVLRSTYTHAKNSVFEKQRERYQQTVDEYYNLISEFPQTRYRREVDRIYKEAVEQTKI